MKVRQEAKRRAAGRKNLRNRSAGAECVVISGFVFASR